MHLISKGYKFDPHSPINKYLQNVLFNIANKHFGWEINFSWAFTSVIFGIIFVFFLFLLSDKLFDNIIEKVFFFLLIISMGATELFFGYVEDYPLVLMFLMVYFFVAIKFIKGELSIFWPSIFMSLLLGASMLTAWLLPSLIYLFISREIRFENRAIRVKRKSIFLFILGLIIPYFTMMIFFISQGVDMVRFFTDTHLMNVLSGKAKHFFTLKELFSIKHLVDFFLEHLLISSVGLFLLFYVIITRCKKIIFDKFVIFLIIASIGFIVFSFVWIPILGAFKDWDLFAVSALPYTILAAYLYAKTQSEDFKFTALILIIGSLILTIPWILKNAFPD